MKEPEDSRELLNQRLKRYYHQQILPPDKLQDFKATLLHTNESLETKPLQPPVRVNNRMQYALASLAIIMVISFISLLLLNNYNHQQQTKTVAEEIALNHQNQFEMDFVSSDVLDLDSAMSQLDFDLIHPIDLAEHIVIGARYCTIDSSIAAQLRIENPTDASAYTLYQFRSPASLQLKERVTIEVDNVTVTLWPEEELIIGLATFTTGR